MALTPIARPAKYAALAELLRDQIRQGIMCPGDRLPSLGEMCAQYGYSLTTVDRALGVLERDGMVVRVNGSGIFVAEPGTPGQTTQPSKLPVGLILPNCQSAFFSQIIEGVESASRSAGYHLMVANSGGNPVLEAQLLQQLAAQTVGLCIMPCGTGNQGAYVSLLEQRIPFVLLDRRVDRLEASLVATDNERAGYLATRHLLECGSRRVYAISRTLELASSLRERVAGFRKALAESGIPFESTLLRQMDDHPVRAGYIMTRDLLEELEAAGRRHDKAGLFAMNEEIARGCYMAIKERGWKIPEEIAIVGFDGTTASLFDPPLTAIQQDLSGIGREGVRRLLELMRTGTAAKPRNVRLQPELIVRNSSDNNSKFCSVSQMLQAPAGSNYALESMDSLVAV